MSRPTNRDYRNFVIIFRQTRVEYISALNSFEAFKIYLKSGNCLRDAKMCKMHVTDFVCELDIHPI